MLTGNLNTSKINSSDHVTNFKEGQDKEILSENINTITMRKNSIDGTGHKSLVIFETSNNKVSFNLKNENEFLNINRVENNLDKVRNSLKSASQGLILGNKLEESINNLNVIAKDKNNEAKSSNFIHETEINQHEENYKETELKFTINDDSRETIEIKNRESEDGLNKIFGDPNLRLETNRYSDIEDNSNQMGENVNDNYNIRTENNVVPKILILEDDINQFETHQILMTDPNPRKYNFTTFPLISMLKEIEHVEVTKRKDGTRRSASNDSEYPLKVCFICDQFYLKVKTFSADDCDHHFCRRCGKAFFEEKIEQGDSDLKCPVFKCKNKMQSEIIKILVSGKHFNKIQENTDGKENKLNNNNLIKSFKKGVTNNFLTHSNTKESIKLYAQKHVIDINTNEQFFIYNKAKEQICIKCSEQALYGKSGKYIVKCLNCFHTICKFCMKSFTSDHFEIASSSNYCKVFFRRRLRNYSQKEKSFCQKYCFGILVLIASYFFIVFYVYKQISKFTSHILCFNKRKNNLLKWIIFSLLVCVFISIVTPFMLLIIPYYSPLFILMQ